MDKFAQKIKELNDEQHELIAARDKSVKALWTIKSDLAIGLPHYLQSSIYGYFDPAIKDLQRKIELLMELQ